MGTATRRRSACPHDCPSTCALEVDVSEGRVGRLYGSARNDYTAGVICAKVARYAERLYHPDRLTQPLIRTGPKGAGSFREASWNEAMERVAAEFLKAEREHGAQAVWPYHYAGTMGLVQRDGIHRLRHAKGYSRQYDTICTNMAWNGFIAGTGRLAGPDPREMRVADCVVIWGTNAVATQVNVMTHAVMARKRNGAKVVVIDVYENDTVRQADMALIVRPGTDAALACAVMHVAFRDGHADRDYMARFADVPGELEAHLKSRTPEWAAAITGLSVEEIEAFAKLVVTTKRTYLRLGYGFTRQRNGAAAMHAATSIATVLGSWKVEGGGAFHNNGAIYKLDKTMIEGTDVADPAVRRLDQSRIGAVLTGDREALAGGPPVRAMIVQNTNPMAVAPEQNLVREGFARDDLFVAVHEQFMTETAAMADVVLPATMFLEHDDIYKGGGHQYVLLGEKLVDPPEGCRENHEVIADLARRVGASHKGFEMTAHQHIDWLVRASNLDEAALARDGFVDVQPSFEEAHYLNGFAYPDGRFRFAPDWPTVPAPGAMVMGPVSEMPRLPDQWDVIETATQEMPFRLVTAPARSFLNSTFNGTEGSRRREGRPSVMIHPDDAEPLLIEDGEDVVLQNERGRVQLAAKVTAATKKGTLIAEGLFKNGDFADGIGINALTGADTVAPFGGAAFHDNRAAIRKAVD